MIYCFDSITNELIAEYKTLDDAYWNTGISRPAIIRQYKSDTFKFVTDVYFRKEATPLPHRIYKGANGWYVNKTKCAKSFGKHYKWTLKNELEYREV